MLSHAVEPRVKVFSLDFEFRVNLKRSYILAQNELSGTLHLQLLDSESFFQHHKVSPIPILGKNIMPEIVKHCQAEKF